jgi:hypothetical protein
MDREIGRSMRITAFFTLSLWALLLNGLTLFAIAICFLGTCIFEFCREKHIQMPFNRCERPRGICLPFAGTDMFLNGIPGVPIGSIDGVIYPRSGVGFGANEARVADGAGAGAKVRRYGSALMVRM